MTNNKRSYKIVVQHLDGICRTTTLGVVDGYVYNDIGIHKVPGQKRWTATHLPSGCMICTAATRSACYTEARELLGKIDKEILRQATAEYLRLIQQEKERIQNEQGK